MRERYLDIVKGLAILCIVLLHYLNGLFPTEFYMFVGSFMISAFYVSSGWISARKTKELSLRGFIKKRFSQLGVPYIYWTAIILFFDSILWLCGYYDSYFIGKEIYKSIVLRGCGTLWFLPAMFFGGIIWQILSKKKGICVIIALVATVAYGFLYDYLFLASSRALPDTTITEIINAPMRVVFNLLQAWVGIAFGYYAYNLSKRISSCKLLFFCGILLLVVSYYLANYFPSGVAWQYLAPLLGPLGWIYFFKSVQNMSIWNYLNYWGKNSLCLMVTHYSITLVIIRLFVTNYLHLPFEGWLSFCAFLISMPVQHLFVIVINKYAAKILGK